MGRAPCLKTYVIEKYGEGSIRNKYGIHEEQPADEIAFQTQDDQTIKELSELTTSVQGTGGNEVSNIQNQLELLLEAASLQKKTELKRT